MQGTLKTFNDRGDSGKTVYQRFCPECGSPILSEADALPGVAIIKAGTLDDASWLTYLGRLGQVERGKWLISCDQTREGLHYAGDGGAI